jgi:LPS export ABC transporter protein LptC
VFKYFLTLTSLGLLVGVFIWPSPSLKETAPLKAGSLASNQAKILRFTSFDKQNRPFVITSTCGHHLSNQKILLHQLEITLQLANGEKIIMKGDQGVYNQEKKMMDLTGGVKLEHSNGTQLATTAATINFEKGTAENNVAVEGYNHQAKIKATGFRIVEEGQRIVFLGQPEFTVHR